MRPTTANRLQSGVRVPRIGDATNGQQRQRAGPAATGQAQGRWATLRVGSRVVVTTAFEIPAEAMRERMTQSAGVVAVAVLAAAVAQVLASAVAASRVEPQAAVESLGAARLAVKSLAGLRAIGRQAATVGRCHSTQRNVSGFEPRPQSYRRQNVGSNCTPARRCTSNLPYP